MPFPLNLVVLSVLADIDFFAVLTLIEVSSSLRKFILGQVLTTANFCRFLRENQYLLHHDALLEKLIRLKHVALLSLSFETLRKRHGQHFYEETFDILGPLLSRLPFVAFRNNPPFPDNFCIPDFDSKGRQNCTLEQIRWIYQGRLA